MSGIPLVSVIMPVYNAERYLRDAVESILAQTFSDFELLAIDDGSQDHSLQILQEYAKQDARVRIHVYENNRGIVAALNQGLALARGTYIARMDADDISRPERFAKQVEFLEEHSETGIVGSAICVIDPDGRQLGIIKFPLDDLSIRWKSLLICPFAHPSIMLRRSLLLEHELSYRFELTNVEDYDLWVRLLSYTEGANLPEILMLYRAHAWSVSDLNAEGQRAKHFKVSMENVLKEFPEFADRLDTINTLQQSIYVPIEKHFFYQRARMAEFYLKLWDSFLAKHGESRLPKSLSVDVYLSTAKLAFYPLFQPGMIRAVIALHKINSCWFWYLFLKLPEALRLRWTYLQISHARKKA